MITDDTANRQGEFVFGRVLRVCIADTVFCKTNNAARKGGAPLQWVFTAVVVSFENLNGHHCSEWCYSSRSQGITNSISYWSYRPRSVSHFFSAA